MTAMTSRERESSQIDAATLPKKSQFWLCGFFQIRFPKKLKKRAQNTSSQKPPVELPWLAFRLGNLHGCGPCLSPVVGICLRFQQRPGTHRQVVGSHAMQRRHAIGVQALHLGSTPERKTKEKRNHNEITKTTATTTTTIMINNNNNTLKGARSCKKTRRQDLIKYSVACWLSRPCHWSEIIRKMQNKRCKHPLKLKPATQVLHQVSHRVKRSTSPVFRRPFETGDFHERNVADSFGIAWLESKVPSLQQQSGLRALKTAII